MQQICVIFAIKPRRFGVPWEGWPSHFPSQEALDSLVNSILPMDSQASAAFSAIRQIQDAIAILQSISVPHDRQNERAALCLLALLGMRPDMNWTEAEAVAIEPIDVLTWAKGHYGKSYGQDWSTVIQSESLETFVQMGFLVELPDTNNVKNAFRFALSTRPLCSGPHSQLWVRELERSYSGVSTCSVGPTTQKT